MQGPCEGGARGLRFYLKLYLPNCASRVSCRSGGWTNGSVRTGYVDTCTYIRVYFPYFSRYVAGRDDVMTDAWKTLRVLKALVVAVGRKVERRRWFLQNTKKIMGKCIPLSCVQSTRPIDCTVSLCPEIPRNTVLCRYRARYKILFYAALSVSVLCYNNRGMRKHWNIFNLPICCTRFVFLCVHVCVHVYLYILRTFHHEKLVRRN